MKGTILFFHKTYGFIRSEGVHEDVFFHSRDLIDNVCQGDLVSFDIIESDKGLKATQVSRIEEHSEQIKAVIFEFDGTFELSELYQSIMTKTLYGIKYAKVTGEKIIATSEVLSEDEVEFIKNKRKGTYVFGDRKIKVI